MRGQRGGRRRGKRATAQRTIEAMARARQNAWAHTEPTEALTRVLDHLFAARRTVAHASEVERARRQSFEDIARNNADAMREQEYARDEALRSSFAETMATAAEIAQQRIGIRRRLQEIAHICGETGRDIALDAVVDAERTTRRLAEEPPAPAGGE